MISYNEMVDMKGLLTFCMDLMHCPNAEQDLDKLQIDAKVVKLLKGNMFQPFLNCFHIWC